ncbi:MAG: YcgN family cysteine cluster protein, partial [Alphaproteobacteria bacterium]
TPEIVPQLNWLPETCAYKLIADKKDLQWWHPLISGNEKSVHDAGISVRRKVISEDDVDDIEDHVQHWLSDKKGLFDKP